LFSSYGSGTLILHAYLKEKLKMFVCTVVIVNLQIEGLCFLSELRNYLHDLDMTSQPFEENY